MFMLDPAINFTHPGTGLAGRKEWQQILNLDEKKSLFFHDNGYKDTQHKKYET
jgi:hypothetical protein